MRDRNVGSTYRLGCCHGSSPVSASRPLDPLCRSGQARRHPRGCGRCPTIGSDLQGPAREVCSMLTRRAGTVRCRFRAAGCHLVSKGTSLPSERCPGHARACARVGGFWQENSGRAAAGARYFAALGGEVTARTGAHRAGDFDCACSDRSSTGHRTSTAGFCG